MDWLEELVSKAEVAYKSGRVMKAIRYGKQALESLSGIAASPLAFCKDIKGKVVALKIFIARCYSAIGRYVESNKIYRELLREDVYISPVVMGIFYNNFCESSTEKMNLNLELMKSCLLLP